MNRKSLQNKGGRLYVFTTSRGKREFLKTVNNSYPPKSLTLKDFIDRTVIVEDKIFIESDTRKLLLKEASEFSNFADLKIPTDFFRFLENSPYILRFFDELAGEYVAIEDLETGDAYGEYDYHLSILKVLLRRYKEILNTNGFTDNITLADGYEINREYIKRFDEIVIHFEGYPTKFEARLYQEVAKITDLKLSLTLTDFDIKLQNSFEGIFLDTGCKLVADLTKREVAERTKLVRPGSTKALSANSRLEQIAALKYEVNRYVQQGIDPEEIAVILPDESFGSMIKLFDRENNFNFSKGDSFSATKSYKLLAAIESFKNEDSRENEERLGALTTEEIDTEEILQNWENREKIDAIVLVLENFMPSEEEEREIFSEELFRLKKILERVEVAKVKEVVHLFLSKLKSRALDHKGGGKITVLGLLETRDTHYKGVIILDFNEQYAPQESVKDLFINTALKKRAGLPSLEDRENYQKSLYYKTIQKAEKSTIIYVENDENRPSRFLKSMGLNVEYEKYDEDLNRLIFPVGRKRKHYEQDIVETIDLASKPLSNSKLKTYLECRRRFYFRYVKDLKPHETDESRDPFRVGSILHQCLYEIYEKKGAYGSVKELENALFEKMEIYRKQEVFLKYRLGVWKEKLKSFIENEIERFEEGYTVFKREAEFKTTFDEVVLNGKIDRIDRLGEGVSVLDYKTGKLTKTTAKNLEKTTDFQLVFYYLLLKESYDVKSLGLYDLNSGKIVHENFLEQKISVLQERIKEFRKKEQNFTLTEDHKNCLFCDYKIICDRQ